MTSQQKVDAFFAKKAAWSEELTFLRKLLLSTNLEEDLKWGMPTYTLANKNVVGLGAFKAHICLWFFQGVFLQDKANKLVNAQEGKTKALRQWRFESMAEIKADKKLIREYVVEAVKNQEKGLSVKPDRKKTAVAMPAALKAFLTENKKVETAFKALTPSQQREYKAYIKEAKQAATKERRIKKIAEMIIDGKGLNDKYR